MSNFTLKRFALILLFSNVQLIFSAAIKQDAVVKFGYAEIASEYIPSLGLTSPTNQAAEEKKADFGKAVFLSDYEKYVTVFGLLEKSVNTTSQPASLSPIAILMQDLNVFSYKSKDVSQRSNSLLAHIKKDTVVTLFGEACLAQMLARPISDVQELSARQDAIRSLAVTHPEHRSTFDAALESYKRQEMEFLACYKDPSRTESDHINKLFFQKFLLNRLNANEYVLNLRARTGDAMVGFIFTASTLLGSVAPYIQQQAMLKQYKDADLVKRMLDHDIMPLSGYFKNAAIQEVKMCNPLHYPGEYKKAVAKASGLSEQDLKTVKTVLFASLGVLAAITAWKIHYTYSEVKSQVETHKIDAYMQRKLISCATLVQAFDVLMGRVENDPTLNNILTTWQKDCTPKSAEFNKLLKMLRSSTFRGNASFFSNIGRVRAAYTLMMKTRDEFGDMARFVGLCDAYLAIAKLHNKHSDLPNKYSFVKFINSDKPSIKLHGFWNPVLDPRKAVGNNVELGSQPQALLVTGSNSGGKSTVMITGLTSAILLAETLTIAPVEYMELAPFDYIATSLKVQDNITSGQSHFVAESQHAAKLIRTIESLGAKKAFLAIDELFEGTTPEVGENGLHDFGLALLKQKNLCFVMVTQYQGKPTNLEAETNGACRNAKIDIVKNEDGTLFRPYKLEFGVSQISVGAELLQEAFSA